MGQRPRVVTSVVAGVAALSLLVSCGQGSGGSSSEAPSTAESPTASGEEITLRIVWWGSDDRAARTMAVLDGFEAENPGVTIVAESQPFDGYLDKLATQVVSGDPPDLIQFPVEAVMDYGQSGVLADLSDMDLSNIEETTVRAGQLDGRQIALPSGMSTGIVVANQALFDAAGVELPDDSTWTWDDYRSLAAEISAGTEEGIYGSAGLTAYMAFGTVMRQQGEGKGLHGFDEPILFEPEDVAAFLQLNADLVESGGAPSAEVIIEDSAGAAEASLMGTNRAAMAIYPASLYTALVASSGEELVPLRMPAWPGDSGNHQMALSAPQYWGVAEASENPDMAIKLLDHILNDVEAGKELMVSRGTPANSEVRAAILDLLDPAESRLTQFFDEIVPEMAPVPLPPAGSNQFQSIMQRHLETVLFGVATPEEAGQAMYEELSGEIAQHQ